MRSTELVTWFWDARFAGVASALAVSAITGLPSASAEPIVTCTSDVVDGVEVDYCVGNPNANAVNGVPGVNVDFEYSLGIGFGF